MVKKTFRDGNYYRHVRFGKRTVKEGECAAVWTCDGTRKAIVGPQRVRLFFSHVRFMDRHVADQNQYLEVQHRDGRMEHQRGPKAMFMDPCLHMSITTRDAFKLAANEVLVVYSEAPRLDGRVVETASAAKDGAHESDLSAIGVAGAVHRRVVRGPAVFIPGADEWVHQFSWHGSVSSSGKGSKTGTPGDEKVPHALNFDKLRCMPDQMYVSVKGVRTTDDAQVTIHLMLFFELKDVEKMLDSTNDPMGDFISAASADVVSFGANNTYETLLQRTAQLSEEKTFPILASRMTQVGFELLKIVYRGYSASETLQTMHDQAIAKRTKLKLEADTRSMEQAQQALELQCKQERSRAECELETSLRSHQAELADRDHAQAMRHEAERSRAALEATRAQNDEELRVNQALKDLGVELTQYLCVSAQKEPDHHIKVDGGAGVAAPALHLELPRSKSHR